MTRPTLAALGDDSGGPLHLSRPAGTPSDHADASPEVLRRLHADWVRQLRSQVVGWTVVVAVSVVTWRVTGAISDGSILPLVALMTVQWVRTALEWRRARRSDPIAVVSDEIIGETARDRDRSEALRQLMSERGSPATWTIAGLVIAVAIFEWLTAGTELKAMARAGLVKPLVAEGEWWRLATGAFVHANPWHLACNVAALVAVGRIIEAYTPRPWLLVTYATAALTGSLASWWLAPGADSFGASGAVMGVVGFMFVLGWRRPDDVPKSVRERIWMAVIATGFIGALSIGLIDNAAHAGGAVAGAILGLIAVPRGRSDIAGASRMWLSAAGGIAAIAIAAGAIQTTVALAGGSSAFTARRPLGRDTVVPIASVSAAVGHDDAGWFLAVTNRSRQALEAYEITIGSPTQGAYLRRDDCCFARNEPGPVPPGGVIRVRLDTIRSTALLARRAAFSFAMFSDGSFEGSSRARDSVVRRRVQVEREAAFWIGTIDKVAAGPQTAAARRLSIYTEARSKYDDVSIAALTAFGIPELIKTAEDPMRFEDAAAATRAGIVSSRDALAVRLALPRAAR